MILILFYLWLIFKKNGKKSENMSYKNLLEKGPERVTVAWVHASLSLYHSTGNAKELKLSVPV